jgi:hypothetical protein
MFGNRRTAINARVNGDHTGLFLPVYLVAVFWTLFDWTGPRLEGKIGLGSEGH